MIICLIIKQTQPQVDKMKSRIGRATVYQIVRLLLFIGGLKHEY